MKSIAACAARSRRILPMMCCLLVFGLAFKLAAQPSAATSQPEKAAGKRLAAPVQLPSSALLLQQFRGSVHSAPPAIFSEQTFLVGEEQGLSSAQRSQRMSVRRNGSAASTQKQEVLTLSSGLCSLAASDLSSDSVRQRLQHRGQAGNATPCLVVDATVALLAKLRKMIPNTVFVPVRRLDLEQWRVRHESQCPPPAAGKEEGDIQAKGDLAQGQRMLASSCRFIASRLK